MFILFVCVFSLKRASGFLLTKAGLKPVAFVSLKNREVFIVQMRLQKTFEFLHDHCRVLRLRAEGFLCTRGFLYTEIGFS